jgi:cytochrome P450
VAAAGVSELLRYESPLQMSTPRYAAEDAPFAGRTILRGEMIMAALGAANRDPAQFAEPDALDLTRSNAASHLAFGHGVHYCLGAHLAQFEAGIAIRSLARAFPDLALDPAHEPPEWDRGFVLRNLISLHLIPRGKAGAL